MRHPWLLVLSLSLAGGATAGGLNLAWQTCASDGGVSNQVFACNTSAGSDVLAGSFVLSLPFTGARRVISTLEIATTPAALPPWLLAGGCVEGHLVPAPFDAAHDVNCQDWTGIGGTAGASITQIQDPVFGSSSRATITLTDAVPAPGSPMLPAGVEYLAFRLRILHSGLVGAESCGGCAQPVGFAFGKVTLTTSPTDVGGTPGGTHVELVQAVTGTSNQAHWQTSAVATRRSTFAAIKSLYR